MKAYRVRVSVSVPDTDRPSSEETRDPRIRAALQ